MGSYEDYDRSTADIVEHTERGQYWEVTYRSKIMPFTSWCLATAADLANDTGKTQVEITTKEGARAINLAQKKFEICDFNHFTLEDSSFTDCAFADCRFIKSHFIGVKFSRCRFELCHFLNVKFENCQFLGCSFSQISASAEHLHFIDTSVSAGSFMNALETNLSALPHGVERDYQKYRFIGAKAKIARTIFLSVRNEPELDQLFDANRCFEIALQRKQIADARWVIIGNRLEKRGMFHRYIVWPLRVAALAAIRVAGFFTDWGRSPGKSVWFFVGATAMFSIVYHFIFGENTGAAVMRALNCTLVFGYTRYPAIAQPEGIDIAMFLNSLAGFCWYALLVPALSKRLFR